jgi:hypothetical protein
MSKVSEAASDKELQLTITSKHSSTAVLTSSSPVACNARLLVCSACAWRSANVPRSSATSSADKGSTTPGAIPAVAAEADEEAGLDMLVLRRGGMGKMAEASKAYIGKGDNGDQIRQSITISKVADITQRSRAHCSPSQQTNGCLYALDYARTMTGDSQ